MIVCYAHGDGLGHLTRLRAFLHTVGRTDEVALWSPSPFAADPRVTGGLRAVPDASGADELIVDAFPAGLKGELRRTTTPAVHLARLLRWDRYLPLLPADPPRFGRTYVLEPLADAHRAYLETVSDEIVELELTDPPAPEPEPLTGWLIMHSGPDAELLELVAYARDMAAMEGVRPRFTLAAPRRPAGLPADVGHRAVYPAWPLARHADRTVTAAGFNTVRQLAPWRDRHRVLPFPRTLDDQYARAARLRSTSGTGPRSARP
ncbi:hypothetical protein [Actinomadura hibisca]|uniref:hypothetical protein n=1 Tax=Actinomadura hibisca TaxID=68565 RepID=UPI00083122D5|nr:hypothetical protein [Actinomadura hibisca]